MAGISCCCSAPIAPAATQTTQGGGAAAPTTGGTAPGASAALDAAVQGSVQLTAGTGEVHANQGVDQNIVHSDGSTKQLYTRTAPEDRAKALGVVQTLMASTAKYQDPNAAAADGFEFLPVEGGNLVHAKAPANLQSTGGLDLQHPSMLLYRKDADSSLHLVGAVLMTAGTAPDLGMGEWHTHDNHVDFMKHVWFTPDNLDAAFSESMPRA